MKNFLFLVLLLCTSLIGNTERLLEVSKGLKATVQYKEVVGIDPNLLSLNIYYSNEVDQLRPVVIYVHGGGWSIGDKSRQLENKVSLCQEQGYILVSTNYRLSPYPFEPTNENRIKYPDHNIDIADAIGWVYHNIDLYGGDKDKIVLLGHSAGAHLVALTATNRKFLEGAGLSLANIRGVAAIDTQGYDVLRQTRGDRAKDLYVNAFGTDELLCKSASPIYQLSSRHSYPKFFIAKRGSSRRVKVADDFIKELKKNGVEVHEVDGSIYDHGGITGINRAIGAPDETTITVPLITFFKTCFEEN